MQKASTTAREIMVTRLLTVFPEDNALEAIRLLARRSITGAPVIDLGRSYLGVFSEKCCMSLFTLAARWASAEGTSAAHMPKASEFMSTKLITLTPETDVFEAVGGLLKNRISGAPVIDQNRRFLGVFSEKTCMSVLIQGAYEQLPSNEVAAFMKTDQERTITEDTDLLACAEIFLRTHYRRLPVLRGDKLVGQVSRRDVLRREQDFTRGLPRGAMVSAGGSEEAVTSAAKTARNSEPHLADTVRQFMDCKAKTITEDIDLLGIAQIFLNTPYRRLPVLREGELVGQISRRDLLMTTHKLMAPTSEREKRTLYLSALATSGNVDFS